MCEELKLIQTHLGIWDVREWDFKTIITQLCNKKGIYIIRCKSNGKLLIGEGALGSCKTASSRISTHMNGVGPNTNFKEDLIKYGNNNFELSGYILEENSETRKYIEYKLQKHYKEICYNIPQIPKCLIIELYKEGKNIKEISQILDCDIKTVRKQIIIPKSSIYSGVSLREGVAWKAECGPRNLGIYITEIYAAENRDYYIVKNNLMNSLFATLNFHNINYKDFIPHKMRNGEVNKHLL